jgi:hypothetical protein
MPFMLEILVVRALTSTGLRSVVFANFRNGLKGVDVGWVHEAYKVDGGCFQVESMASLLGRDFDQHSAWAVNLQ